MNPRKPLQISLYLPAVVLVHSGFGFFRYDASRTPVGSGILRSSLCGHACCSRCRSYPCRLICVPDLRHRGPVWIQQNRSTHSFPGPAQERFSACHSGRSASIRRAPVSPGHRDFRFKTFRGILREPRIHLRRAGVFFDPVRPVNFFNRHGRALDIPQAGVSGGPFRRQNHRGFKVADRCPEKTFHGQPEPSGTPRILRGLELFPTTRCCPAFRRLGAWKLQSLSRRAAFNPRIRA